jgi:diguanylate cyclase (GGDEF)-like protein
VPTEYGGVSARLRASLLPIALVATWIAASAAISAWALVRSADQSRHVAQLAKTASQFETLTNALTDVTTETMYLLALDAFDPATTKGIATYEASASAFRRGSMRETLPSFLRTMDAEGAKALTRLDALGVELEPDVRHVLEPLPQAELEDLQNGGDRSRDARVHGNAITTLTVQAGRARDAGDAARLELTRIDAVPPWRDPVFLGVALGALAVALAISAAIRRRLAQIATRAAADREDLERRSAQLESLLELMRAASKDPDLEAVAEAVATQARKATGAAFAVVFLDQRGEVAPIAVSGTSVPRPVAAAGGIVARVIETADSVRMTTGTEPGLPFDGPLSLAAAPLVTSGRAGGVVVVGRPGDSLFDEDAEMTLLLLTRGAAAALETARYHDGAAELATIDGLTGLYNRRRLEDDLGAALRDAEAGGRPTSVAMVDIDHFKQLNDTLGHQAGDDALRRVAATLRACLRGRDAVYRYGGEEFCVVLPDTPTADALAVAERIRASIAADESLPTSQPGRPLSVSAGVATALSADLTDVMRRADEALYAAKEAGRNRVVAASPGSGTAAPATA